MYSFKNDYSEGMHPHILKAFQEGNLKQDDTYGLDCFCEKARQLISKKIGNDSVDIHFVGTGTQANLITLSSILRPHESIIAAYTAHIAVHETGAIESTGHKINTVSTTNGKLTVEDIESVLKEHADEHMVKPKLVFISNSTELGSFYLKSEIIKLSECCKKNDLYFYLDGARIGAALTADGNDLKFSDLPHYFDAFYIGGTKNGGMFGEAIVLVNPNLKKDFRYLLKQKGALVSKSKFLGIQFIELFKDELFLDLARHTNLMAHKLATGIKKAGYKFLETPATNLVFPILPNALIKKISSKYDFYVWKEVTADTSAIRLVTSWATELKTIDSFLDQM